MKIIEILSDRTADGPAVRMAVDLSHGLSAAGHVVEAVCRKGSPVAATINTAGVKVTNAPLKGGLDVVSPVRLSKILREAGGRVIMHVHRFSDAVIASRARTLAAVPDVKIVLTRHLTTPAKTDVAASAIYADIDAIIFPTRESRRQFFSTGPKGIAPGQTAVIATSTSLPNRVDGPVAVRDAELLTLLCCGAITPTHGIDQLVEAMNLLKELPIRLVVIGEGHGTVVMPSIRAARRYGIADRIDWRGAGANIDSVAKYEADLAIVADRELPLQGGELTIYSAAGLPVVASDMPITREIFGDRATYFAPGNARSLADAIASAVSGGRPERLPSTDASRMVNETETFFTRLLCNQPQK